MSEQTSRDYRRELRRTVGAEAVQTLAEQAALIQHLTQQIRTHELRIAELARAHTALAQEAAQLDHALKGAIARALDLQARQERFEHRLWWDRLCWLITGH